MECENTQTPANAATTEKKMWKDEVLRLITMLMCAVFRRTQEVAPGRSIAKPGTNCSQPRRGRGRTHQAHALPSLSLSLFGSTVDAGSRHAHSKNSLVWTPGRLCRFDVAWRCLARKDCPPVSWTMRSSADRC